MKLKLIKKVTEAKGTKSFFWEPEKEVNYIAGQYFYFTLPHLNYPDPRGSTRHFTLSSSPTEGGILRNTTRIREESGFKKTLDELSIDSIIEGEGPNGTFALDEKEPGPHIFIAGGIGITPYRSMIKYAFDKNLNIPIYLIYSNSDSDFAFEVELKEIDTKSESIHVAFHDSSKSGHLDDKLINKLTNHLINPTYWLCGPPPMIDAMEQVLGKLKITSDHIRSEKFTGY